MLLGMFRTAFFLVSICCCSFYWCHGCLEEERTLLLQIKATINYPAGSSLDEEWVGKDCCQWHEVDCNPSSSRVISIQLFQVREERFGLWYPNASLFTGFKELEKLNLWNNYIGRRVMPKGLCKLKNLRVLSLIGNDLNGRAIPRCLSNLDELWLWGNDLGSYSSTLTGLCKLRNLRVLNLDGNKLDGRALPPCLSNLPKLEELSLVDNDHGSYSSDLTGICELTTLRLLDLDGNRLNDHSILKCLGNLSLLEELYLGHNKLKSSLSNLTAFSGMQSLRKLDLSSNNLSAGIDSLRGSCELKNLQVLYLDRNSLDGRAFPPCLSNLSKLEELSLEGNDLGSYSSALTGFCELRNLQYLNVESNSYVGSIPQCFGNMNSLRNLHLSHNQLTGTIPSSIFQNLTKLMFISASHNQFNDSISFSTFANLSKLLQIDNFRCES